MSLAQVEGTGVLQDLETMQEKKRLIEEARSRAAEERDLSSTTEIAHYVAASLGQPPYVSMPGVGVVVLRKGGWSC